MYVAMDRKPDNGGEIHNAACRWSVIMMRLRIVKSSKNKKEYKDDEYNLPHGTKVLKELVIPWANMDKTVCAYSYSASVPAPSFYKFDHPFLILTTSCPEL